MQCIAYGEIMLGYQPIHIVRCQAHPALVKWAQQSVRIFQFLVVCH